MPLPIESQLPRISAALTRSRRLILSAAPGAGKTTCVPPELLNLTSGKILLVEPRRVAARAAAARIAALRGEKIGGTAGFQVRGDRAVSAATRIVAVTPGILLRMLQDDPLLEDVGAVIFDEFHERQWECDLGLAFVLDLEKSAGKRLFITIMTATPDLDKLRAHIPDAEYIEVPGKMFPVELRWSDNAPDPRSIAADAGKCVLRLLNEKLPGDILVFLPGAGEISRLQELLAPAVPDGDAVLLPLHGGLPLDEQLRALSPDPRGRKKIVLATNVAESSLTIDGVTVVVDSGWERRMEYDPAAGMSFLKLLKITRDSAAQRAGRAGRTAPGVAVRLWNQFDHAARREHAIPEILRGELAPLLLEIRVWGSSPEQLSWLDAPPEPALLEAEKLLRNLGALDGSGSLTRLGRRLAELPVHPRLGAMLLRAEKLGALDEAIRIAAMLEDRDHQRRSADLTAVRGASRDAAVLERQLRRMFPGRAGQRETDVPPGALLAGAFPDWIAQRREPHGGVYRLSGGRAARLAAGDDLERCEFLAVAGISGGGGDGDGVIRLAAPLSKAELENHFADAIISEKSIVFNPDTGRASGRFVRRLGALILGEGAAGDVSPEELSAAVISAATGCGLTLPPSADIAATRLLRRLRFARRLEPDAYPDWSEECWSGIWPELAAGYPVRCFTDLEKLPWNDLMRNRLGRDTLKTLDRDFPPVFKPPRGPEIKLDYSQDVPTLAVRIQALYTLDVHPSVGRGKLPLKLELLSPASRPVQITGDLPGFWRGSWKIVRKEMKSRYPKHDWPEDPLHPAAGYNSFHRNKNS